MEIVEWLDHEEVIKELVKDDARTVRPRGEETIRRVIMRAVGLQIKFYRPLGEA